jgi:hypothetical protein
VHLFFLDRRHPQGVGTRRLTFHLFYTYFSCPYNEELVHVVERWCPGGENTDKAVDGRKSGIRHCRLKDRHFGARKGAVAVEAKASLEAPTVAVLFVVQVDQLALVIWIIAPGFQNGCLHF